MLGFVTTMKGRLRRACIRCASRDGRIDRVKLADLNSAWSESGGFPYLTKSASVSRCIGLEASLMTSASNTA